MRFAVDGNKSNVIYKRGNQFNYRTGEAFWVPGD
jgi:hypothetical protein